METILAARSEFSLGEAILDTGYIIDQAKALNMTCAALTDTMTISGMVDFTNKAVKEEIKPIIGVRLRLTEEPLWRPASGQKKKHMPRTYFLSAYARTEEGMKLLYRVLTAANSEPRFYYEAKYGIDEFITDLTNCDNGDLAIVYDTMNSLLEHPKLADIAERIKASGCEAIYAPFAAVATPYFARITEKAMDLVEKGFAEPLAVRASLYATGEADAKDAMLGVVGNQKISSGMFKLPHQRNMHVMSEAEFARELLETAKLLKASGRATLTAHMKTAIANTDVFPTLITYQWEQKAPSLPKLAPNEFAAVAAECKKGWTERFSTDVFGHKPGPDELRDVYMPRLKYELDTLKRLDFCGYFLLVQNIVQHAKSSGIMVGPGRGSVGGSLVAYLMGITDCDPIRFGLMFERFINPERIDLPDADLDFMATRRHEIFEYLYKRFGDDYVAGVSNYGALLSPSAIRSVAKLFQLPEREFEVSKMVPKKHGQPVSLEEATEEVPEIKTYADANPVVWGFTKTLEGKMRSYGQHAAGMIVAGEPLINRAVLEKRTNGQVVNWDKRIVESQGLVKMDILGLSTLDLISLTLNYIRENYPSVPDIYSIPLDDEKVLANFAEGNTVGVFQFESPGMRNLLRNCAKGGTITFEDITAATALYRPGPMDSGMMDNFVKRKQGVESVSYDHPLMEPILNETLGVIIYQEQVMRISQVICGYSGADADKLRKIMGKKEPAEMAKQKEKFVQGAIDTVGAAEKWADQLFDNIAKFAGYGFNKSHSIEYTLISYQSMYLKTYYPTEFYAAALSILDEDKLIGIVRDASRAGIDVVVPDINESTNRFEILNARKLLMPFNRIKGISEKTGDAILTARAAGKFTSITDFLDRVEKRRCNAKHQDLLNKVGAYCSIDPASIPVNDPSRILDQYELLPGLVTKAVPINRSFSNDKATREIVTDVVNNYHAAHGATSANPDGLPVKPIFGKHAAFMIVTDAPHSEDEKAGQLGNAKSSTALWDALDINGLKKNDIYWTSVVKRPKTGKFLNPEEVALYSPYLDQEIEYTGTPVVVACGSAAIRHFDPEFKGRASERAGEIFYDKKRDLNVVIGFNPGEIYFDPDKLDLLVNTITVALDLVG